jgi:hypothetical protein
MNPDLAVRFGSRGSPIRAISLTVMRQISPSEAAVKALENLAEFDVETGQEDEQEEVR